MSLGKRINNFFKKLGNLKEIVSPSSFYEARKKIDPELYKYLNSSCVQQYYEKGSEYVKTWRGRLLWAVDCTTVNLPDTEETRAFYTKQGNNKTSDVCIQATSSILYDVLNEVPINAEIAHRQAEKNFVIDKHQHLYRENAVVLYDRLYTDYAIIGLHNMLQKDFVIRCPSSQTFSQIEKFIASKKTDSLVVLKKPRNFTDKNISLSEVQVRLIKVELPTGEIEILVTSLLDQEKYPLDEFLWLYHQRWGIETYFGRLKNILDVQRFSSGFSQEIEQDFFSIILTSSIESIISKEDDMQLQQECFEKGTKYQYKINKSVSYAEIADVVVDLLLDTNKSAEEIFEQLKITFRRSPCAIRPNRSFERKKRGSNQRLRFHKYRKRT